MKREHLGLYRLFTTGPLIALMLTVGPWIQAASPTRAQPATPASAAESGKQPNIVFLLTDDLDLTSYQDFPNFKKYMLDQGTYFDHYFVDDSLCCPSRSSTLRGQYVHNTGVQGNVAPNGGFQRFHDLGNENSTIGTWLQADGYQTALIGKYLNGYPGKQPETYVPPGWSEWDSPAAGNPYGEYNYTLNENGKLVKYGDQPEDYGTDVYGKKADAFITQSAANGKPFFLYLATYAPHQPATAAPQDLNAFPNATAPRTPSFNEQDMSDKPAWIRDRALQTDKQVTEIDALYWKRLQSMLDVDRILGNLVTTLQASGQLDNTYIVFASDNGFHLGQHRLPPGKQTAYEEDIHVPMVIRGPGIAAAAVNHELVANIDLAPTFAAIADASVPDFVDGRSIMPLVSANPPTTWRQSFAIEHFVNATSKSDPDNENFSSSRSRAPANKKGANKSGKMGAVPPTYVAIRTTTYLYVQYDDGERELYDLTKDPFELDNLAPQASTGLMGALEARVKAFVGCKGSTCRSLEEEAPPRLDLGGTPSATPTATPTASPVAIAAATGEIGNHFLLMRDADRISASIHGGHGMMPAYRP
ncbi:MAG: sulfatase-like hydrolase/transferase [Thermomicrobiales bacterium]